MGKIEWEEKCWGEVRHLFHSPHAAVSHLKVKAGTRCSIHYHRSRVNQFCVISGRIQVEIWDDYDHPSASPVRIEELGPGDDCEVPIYKWHRFRVLEDGELIEVYWPWTSSSVVDTNDIVRYDQGGVDGIGRRHLPGPPVPGHQEGQTTV